MRLFESGISEQAFAKKWETSKEKMYRLAFCYVKQEQDALDILSEATYKAYCSLDQLKEPKYFDSWMGKIIIRASLDYLKKQKPLSLDAEVDYEQADKDGSIDQFEQSEIRLDVYAALDFIHPEERTYIILKYFEDRSFLEISQMMDIPEATVKTKVYRSLKKMRNYWKNAEE